MTANYVLLDRVELNATTASVTFSNIPQTGYTDLKLVISGRSSYASVDDAVKISFNSNTSNYSSRTLYGTGSSAGSISSSTNNYIGGWLSGANATASTFNNTEIYIPNYTSSNYKSSSTDSVTENSGSSATSALVAGLWSNTSAVTSITLTPENGSFVSGSTFSLYGVAAYGTTPTVAPKADGGNVIATDGTYWYHTFLTSGTFTPQTNLTCDYLVVAGGGGGGYNVGSGAGAGGYLTGTTSVSTTPITITVGAGGAGGTSSTNPAPNGSNSVFSSFTAIGGGGGGDVTTGSSGGSGGGGNTTGGTATSGQGYDGGAGIGGGSGYGRPGGGGAGAIGATGQSNAGGDGGVGLSSSISGTATYYAGGGGGGLYGGAGATGNGGAGGNGGGGAGSKNGAGTSGTVNTGGGGGGGGNSGSGGQNGGAGGSGIIIIRYPVAS